jgi:4-aminobutyrate aminotransferase
MGRTGKLFASEHWGIEPDIICLAKGIASGMPLGAIVARADVMDWTPGTHASTFGGNPVCCAAALATLDLLEQGLIERAAETGAFLMERLGEMQSRHPLIGEVRGRGLMIGVELVGDRGAKTPARSEAAQVIQRSFRHGLLLLPCGESTIRISPPLVLTREQAETALGILDDVLSELEHD